MQFNYNGCRHKYVYIQMKHYNIELPSNSRYFHREEMQLDKFSTFIYSSIGQKDQEMKIKLYK